MKSFYISVAIILSLLIGWVYISNHLNESVEDINKDLITLENSVYNDNWDEADRISKVIDLKWKESSKLLMLVIDHNEMEQVNFSLSQVKAYLSIKDKALLTGEIGSLKYLINHVKEKESLSLDNIF